MARNKNESPSMIPLMAPELQEFQSLSGSYEDWQLRSKEATAAGHADLTKYCLRRAYFDSTTPGDSLFAYMKNIVMSNVGEAPDKIDHYAHKLMCEFLACPGRPPSLKTVQKRVDLEYIHGSDRYKMLQASRFSFKSTIGAIGYASWRVAQEYVRTGVSSLTILFASENMELAKKNVTSVKNLHEWSKPLIDLAGDHRGAGADKVRWSVNGITSQFRADPTIAAPTYAPISVKAPRTGFHFDLLILDDLQAESMSTSLEQIEVCFQFWKLLNSIQTPGDLGEQIILCTRWHNTDVYKRLEDMNSKLPPSKRLKILKIPARNETNRSINFPTIYTEEGLNAIETKQDRRIYANQYMLKAIADEDIELRHKHVQYWTPEMLEGRKMNRYITGDFAWTERSDVGFRPRAGGPDFTAIFVVDVDEDWNYYVIESFRARCTVTTSIKELYRQYMTFPGVIRVLLQKYDRAHIKEGIEQYGHLIGRGRQRMMLPLEWVSYPAKASKIDRIRGSLVPQFHNMKIWLRPDMQWLVNEEIMNFPAGRKDGLDSLCNVTYYSNPAIKSEKRIRRTEEQETVAMLKAGMGHPLDRGDDSWKSL